jgi:hypothetical protein
MSRIIVLIMCVFAFTSNVATSEASWDTVVFRDDCDGSTGSPPNATAWVVNHPGNWWWVQGRTQFPDPLSTTGPFPHVDSGICVIEHHHFNPWDLGNPNTAFLGGEIHSVAVFAPDQAYRFEARVRSSAQPNGLVTSFFLYGYDGTNSDEIDFEFVSNQTNDDATYPTGDPLLTNPWNESAENPELVPVTSLDLSQWNTFRIYWYPGIHRIDWTWMDPVAGETLLRQEKSVTFVPDQTMALYFNFWAPASTWPDAHDASLQPANDSGSNQTYLYEIDYAEARTLSTSAPALSDTLLVTLAFLMLASGALLSRRARSDSDKGCQDRHSV